MSSIKPTYFFEFILVVKVGHFTNWCTMILVKMKPFVLPNPPPLFRKTIRIDVKGKSKHIPIRRTGKPVSIHVSSVLASSNLETFIELVGSTVVAQKPTNIDVETGSEEDVANEEETTPRPRALDEDVELYETPVVLTPAVRKSRTRKVIVPDDTEVESSDIEEVVRSSVHVHLSVVD